MSVMGLVNFTIPKTDIVHTKSGLILHYLSEYRPADKIVTFTVTIPMVPDMCYLIPQAAKKKIPHCRSDSPTMLKYAKESITPEENKRIAEKKPTRASVMSPALSITKGTTLSDISRTRTKRALPVIIAIGAGVAMVGLAIYNQIQAANLRADIKLVEDSLRVLDQTAQSFQAQILHLNEGQLKLAQELNYTQVALNKTIAMVNEHAHILREHEDALRTVISQTIFLSTRLASAVHAMETHFVHTSIEKMLSNQLNLLFVHQQDMPKVVDLISQAINITFDEADSSIPTVALITRLLVRQQIDFLQTKEPESTDHGPLIGQLIFTSFFAAPNHDQAPFSIYELLPIPFNLGDKRARLAQMPAFLGIEPKSQQFIRWSREEAKVCDFVQMSSCRETPARRKESQDDCLYQILTDSKLQDCRVEPYADAVFVHRIGNHWAISSNKTTKCHSVTTLDANYHSLHDKEEIVLPPVALITTMNTDSLACDRFFLPGLPIAIGEPIHLIYNESVSPIHKDLLDLQASLANETHWAKLPYIPSDVQALIEFINNTPKPTTGNSFLGWKEHTTFFGTIVMMVMIFALGIVLLYFMCTKKSVGTNISITMPSMKTLQAMQEQS
ncbi:unnamed protein product [Rotaria magnacalcarata]